MLIIDNTGKGDDRAGKRDTWQHCFTAPEASSLHFFFLNISLAVMDSVWVCELENFGKDRRGEFAFLFFSWYQGYFWDMVSALNPTLHAYISRFKKIIFQFDKTEKLR